MAGSRRIHHAAEREVRSGNIVPFASRKLLVSLFLRLCLRTSRAAGCYRLVAAACALAAASFCGLLVFVLALVLALAVLLTSWRSLLPRKAWEDPSSPQTSRLPTHSRLCNYPTFEEAAAASSGSGSPNVVSLSGTWKFLLASGVSASPGGFEDPGFSDGSWDDIDVPGHWQLQDAGSRDPPIYTNTSYPFPNHPPYAPRENPTGLYRRRFALPAEWLVSGVGGEERPNGRFSPGEGSESARLKGRVVLVFQGVDSAFHVWVNGLPVGFAKGSRLPCEFDVTDALRGSGEQYLCLRVVRWSDGSYLEDQDHWWLSGVYREVELALRPAPVRISDFVVRPFLCEGADGAYTRGSLEVEVLLEHDAAAHTARPPSTPSNGGGAMIPGATTAAAAAAAAGLAAVTADDGGGGGGSGGDNHHPEECTSELLESEDDGARTASFIPLGNLAEAVEAGEAGSRVDALATAEGWEVECTLLDTATGQRWPLELAGTLPDWQMGLPPNEEQRRRRGAMAQHDSSGKKPSRFRRLLLGMVFSGRRSRPHDGGGSSGSSASSSSCYAAGGGSAPTLTPRTAWNSVRFFRLRVPGKTRAWSAEDPQLYTLVVSLKGGGGGGGGGGLGAGGGHANGTERAGRSPAPPPPRVLQQFESARVGFRNVVVASGQLLVNGAAVMVAGVNRHEHDPDTGKTVSEESMRRDIVLMKRFNFNAVRNCHYPNHWRWYELCDELGLYVCDEANIESHGQIPLGRLSADPSWRLAYLDRVWRMLAANKNHACVVLWSLGNESGDGENLAACRRLVKKVDPSRPVVYEGGGKSLAEGCGCTDLTDVVCPMYPTVETTELLGTDGPDGVGETRPCVLCEYSHAMGNSNGNLHKYWELFRRHRRLQGGFIWDWVDQGLTRHDPITGRRYWADGGGFAGGHSKGYDAFCVNGVTFPDRSPHPALYEAKFLAQPVGIELLRDDDDHHHPLGEKKRQKKETTRKSGSPGSEPRVLFTNRYAFSSLDHLSLAWRLESSASAAVASGADPSSPATAGRLSLSGLMPGESREVLVGIGRDDVYFTEPPLGGRGGGRGDGREFFLHVEARLAVDTAWASEGHLVAWACFPLERASLPPPLRPPPPPAGGLAGGSAEAEEGVGGGGASQTVVVPTPSHGFIAYEDEEGSAQSSREASPLGQLRQHLLTDIPAMPPSSSVIVMRGLLDPRGVVGPAEGEQHRFSQDWTLVVSKTEGNIVRFVAGGVDLIEPGAGPSLCFWRAATDNDRAGWPTLLNFVADHRLVGLLSRFMPLSRLSHLERWRASGLCASDPPVFRTQGVRVEKSTAQECIIRVKTRCASRYGHVSLFDIATEIRVSPGGSLEMTAEVEPLKGVTTRDCLSLARVGVLLQLPPGFGRVEWFGKGPFECYQDRKHGATTGVFSGTVEDQHVPYMVPSENGGKADVRWMALRKGEGGAGLLMQAERGAVFQAASVSLHSAAELHKAKRTVDLAPRTSSEDPVYVHLDHRSMGVGGDNSWYPDVVHREYTVPADKAYSFRVRLRALVPGAAASLAALVPGASS